MPLGFDRVVWPSVGADDGLVYIGQLNRGNVAKIPAVPRPHHRERSQSRTPAETAIDFATLNLGEIAWQHEEFCLGQVPHDRCLVDSRAHGVNSL